MDSKRGSDRTKIVSSLLFAGAAFLTNATPANLSPATPAESPFELLTAAQRDYLYVKTFDQRCAAAGDANDAYDTLFCYGSPVALSWTGTSGSCGVSVKRLADGKIVWSGTSAGTSAETVNLELGADYEWTVADSTGAAASARFRTSDRPPRLIKSGRVKMLRDLGGWTGTLYGRAYRIRQNLIFRGAATDVPDTGEYLLDGDDDRAFFYNVVGLKNEVDLRDISSTSDVAASSRRSGEYMFDPTGEHVTYNNFPIANNTLPTSGSIVSVWRLLTTPAKLPAYFHCKSGRDRTGLVAAVLLAVLGVPRDDIVRDYQTTSDKNDWTKYGFNTILDSTLATYKSANLTLAENARAYLLACGISSQEVETFRETMLEGYTAGDGVPVDFCVTPYVQHPATNAMSVIFFTTESCVAKARCWRADGKGGTNELSTACADVSDKLGKNALGNSDTLTYAKQYRHRVRFENLRTLTDYRYEVALPNGVTYRNAFRTLPGRDTPVRFIGYCDCETTPNGSATDWSNHAGDYGVRNVSKYFVGLTEGYASNIVHMVSRRPDLITISGDLAAKGGYQKNWDEFWRQNAGANGSGYNDPAGSIPILAAIGNHDLKDAADKMDDAAGGESALEKYLTYFEYNPNGVHYAVADGTNTAETRDMGQLFHREDLGPVTLIFLDTNKGAKGKDGNSTQDYSDRPAMRAPDFHPGSLQYNWLTNQLADAQRNSRFTFVINHHCPYSVGQHNRPSNGKGYTGYNTGSGYDGESARAVRCLTETMIRYGVDAWLCGHDEIMEHSQTNGFETLPDGTRRAHTLNVYDLGSGGDGLRGDKCVENPLEVFRAYEDAKDVWENGVLKSGGCHYGFMEVDVTTNRNGRWTCSLTPCYDFINQVNGKAAGFRLLRYRDRIIIDGESDEIVYQERLGDAFPADYVEYVRPGETGPGLVVPAEPDSFAVTPYLQRPAPDAMTLVFFTKAASTATVTCRRHDGTGATFAETTTGVWAEALTNNVFCKESSEWNNSLYRHCVRFEGLEANRTYDYTVTLAGGTSYSNAFRTAPDRNTPIRFVSYADCETEKDPWPNYVANLKRMKDRRPDFFALSGDYAARGGRQEHWDGFWKANAGTETDVAGSIPILAVIGNHDLFDQGRHTGGYWYDMQGEPSTDRYASYFGPELYYRADYGPVTLIFLDTNNGQDGDTDADHDRDTNYLDTDDGSHLKGGLDRRKGCRHPDFNVGSPQYAWLTNNLADAQAKSRFTFVFNHHCPYSRGAHNRDWREHEDGSALALRALTETMVRYGVDGWYCGHDELLEHSITNGWEILPDGSRRKHTLSVYDLGCSGDTPRSSDVCANPLEYWWSSDNYGGASKTKYGFLETDVTTNRNGQWTCTITPVQGSTGSYVPGAQIVYVENQERGENENDLVYAETANRGNPIDGASQTKPSDWVAWEKPPEGLAWDETVDVELTEVSAADLTYNGSEQSPHLTVRAGDLTVPRDHYTVTASPASVRDAREYSVTVTGTGNVRGSKTAVFKVNRAPATVKAKNISMVVGTVPEPRLEVEVTGTFGTDTVTCTELSREDGSDVGTYAITVTGEAVQGNYDVTFVNGWFTIKEDVVFVDGEDAEIAVDGEIAVDVGETAIKVGKVTVRGTGDLTISNCQNLTANSVDLSGLDGTVTYEYVSSSANKSLPSNLKSAITGQSDQKVKYAFRGTSAANGWNFGGTWSGSAGKALIPTHLIMEEGTHAWTVEVSSDNTSTYFGANGTDANPTLLIGDGATLNFTVHDLSGYKGTMNAGGVIRVNAGGRLNVLALTSGSYHNFNYRQRLVLDPGSETVFDYSSSYLFVIHGGSDIGGDVTRAQIYVPAGDGTAGPAVLRRKSSGGAGLCINGNSASRGGGCAIYVGAGSKLLLDSSVKIGESDSGSGDRTLAKYGAGELEITGEVTKDVAFKAYAGIVTLPASSGAFNGGLTATADVTYRFPSGWPAETAYTLGSGAVTGTAPAADAATVYVGREKLTGATLAYSGKTVWYAMPSVPPPPAFAVTPYVQHPATDAMTIRFFTRSACEAEIRVWERGASRPAEATFTTTGEESRELVSCGAKDDVPMWGTMYRHSVRATGLAAGTKYDYEVTLVGGDAYANAFRTAPGRDTAVRFVAYSDSETVPPPPFVQDGERTDAKTGASIQWERNGAGTKTPYYVSRSRGFAENISHMQGEEPDLILVAGDIAARGGVQAFWDEYWKENAGGLGIGYNDPAGSTPILAAPGNHDLYDNRNASSVYSFNNGQSDFAISKYLAYFEFEPNDGDGGQLYHRQDYGPVTILFLDTVKTGFASGSTQYKWIERNLADAQENAKFTIVVSHQTPYSGGKHGDESDVLNVRNTLGPLMVRYGVDAWLCGHCEAQEHSQVTGTEVLADGSTRAHTMDVYDLGSGGDGLLCAKHVENPCSVFNSLDDSEDGIHYGHLLIDVKPNTAGVWQLTMTPAYACFKDADTPSELRYYEDMTIVAENGVHVYEERKDFLVVVRPVKTSRQYGEADPAIDYTFEPATWPDGTEIVLSGALGRTAGDAAGTYDVTLGTLASSDPGCVVMLDEAAARGAFEITRVVPTVTIPPAARTITYGQTLAEALLEGGEASVEGTFAWAEDGARPTVADSGRTEYEYVFRPQDGANYENLTARMTVTVSPKAVTVRADDAGKTYGDPDPELTATAEGLVGDDTLVYSVERVAGESVGPYAITARGAADQGNYTVSYEGGTFTISRRVARIRAVDVRKTYGDPDPELTAEVTGLLEGDTVAYELKRTEGEDARLYSIIVTGETSQGGYDVVVEDGTFLIDRRTATVTANAAGKAYGEGDPELTAEVTGLVGEDAVAYTVGRVPGENVGTYAIAPSGSPVQGNYNVVFKAADFSISPRTATVTAVAAGKTYGAADPELTATVTGLVGSDTVSYALTRESGEDVGSYAITADVAASQGNYTVRFVSALFTVEQATLDFASAALQTYTGAKRTPVLTVKAGDVSAAATDYTVSAWSGDLTAVGTYTATVTGKGNFRGSVTVGFEIRPATLTAATAAAQTYDGTPKTPVLAVLAGDVAVPADGYDIGPWDGDLTDAGTYHATVTGTGNFSGEAKVTFTVNKATYDLSGVAFANGTFTYDAREHELAITGDLPEGVTVAYTGNGRTDVGSSTVTAVFSCDTRNYNEIASRTATLKVNAAAIDSATAAPQQWTGRELAPAVVVRAGDLVCAADDYTLGKWSKNGSSSSWSWQTVKLQDVATYTATVTGKGNFTGTATVTFTIEKADYDLSNISFEDATVTYDGRAHSLEIGGTLPGDVKVSYEGNGKTAAGTYTVTAKFSGETTNHNAIPSKTATLTIDPAQLTSATAASATYDGTKKEPKVTAKAGELTATCTVGDWSGNLKDAGTYTATVKGTGNFGGEATVSFTIGRRPVTVTALNCVIHPGEGMPDFKWEVTKGSLAGGDHLAGSPACAYQGEAGTYPITQGTLTDASNPNYTITFVDGQMMVANFSIEFTPESGTYSGESQEPESIVVKDGDKVLTKGTDYTIAKVSGTMRDAGDYTYAIVGAGDYADLGGTATWTIRPKRIAVTAKAAGKTYGEDDRPLEYESDALFGDDEFTGGLVREEGEDAGSYVIGQGTLDAGKNYSIDFTAAVFTIARRQLTVTARAANVLYGDEPPSSFDYVIAGFAADEGIGSAGISGEPVLTCAYAKGNGVGAYDIAVDVSGMEARNYAFVAGDPCGQLTVAVRELTSATAASQTYTGEVLTPVLTVMADGLEAGSADYSVGDWSGSLQDAGTYTATVTGKGNCSGTATVSFTIEKADYDLLDISFEDATVTYDGQPHALGITGGLPSGVEVTYEENGQTDVGDYTVTANFKGDANHNTIPSRTAVLTIKPVQLTSASAAAQTYDGTPKEPQVVAKAGDLAATCTVSAWDDDLTDAGTYHATATGTGNFTGTVPVSFTVRPATIDFASATEQTYDGTLKTPALTVKSGKLAATFTVGDWNGNLTDAGTYTATVTGTDNFTGEQEVTFTVGRLALTSATAASATYDGNAKEPVLTVIADGIAANDYTVGGWTGNLTDAGTYTGTVTGKGNFEGFVKVTFTIEPRPVTVWNPSSGSAEPPGPWVAASDVTETYDGTGHRIDVISGNFDTDMKLEFSRESAEGPWSADAGCTDVLSDDQDREIPVRMWCRISAKNYSPAVVSACVTILRRPVMVTADDLQMTYGMNEPTLTATVDGAVGDDPVEYGLSREPGSDAGTYAIHATGDRIQGNYTVEFTDGLLTIDPASLTEATAADQIYDGTAKTPVLTVKAGGIVCTTYDPGVWSGNLTDAGTYTNTVTGTGNFSNTVPVVFTIRRAAYDMSGIGFSDLTVDYDGEPHALAVTGELPDGVTVAYEGNGASDAGPHAVTAKFAGDAANYEPIPDRTATLTIRPRKTSLAVSIANGGLEYDGAERSPRMTVTDGERVLAEGRDFEVIGPGREVKDAGSYIYTLSGIGNYAGSSGSATLVILRKKVKVTAAAVRKTYGEGDPAFRIEQADVLIGSDAYAGAFAREPGEDVGDYGILIGTFTAGPNYEIDFTSAVFTIEPRPVTVTADDLSKRPVEADPELTARVEGLVPGEDVSLIAYSLARAPGDEPGTYAITPSGDELQRNYRVTFVNGTFTVRDELYVTIPVRDGLVSRVYVDGVELQPAGESEGERAYEIPVGSKVVVEFAADGNSDVKVTGGVMRYEIDGMDDDVSFGGDDGEYGLPETIDVVADDYKFVPGVPLTAEDVFGTELAARVADPDLSWTVSGLPAGLKFNSKTRAVTGAPTAALKTYVTKLVRKEKSTAVETVVVTNATKAFPIVHVAVAPGFDGTGKVSGENAKTAANKTITLKATADKRDAAATATKAATVKSAFAGWYLDEACTRPSAGDWRNPSYAYTVTPAPETTLYAKFVRASDPSATNLAIEVVSYEYAREEDFLVVPAGTGIAPIRIYVDSPVKFTVTAKNLPSGLKLVQDKATGGYSIEGKATKPGELEKPVTLTVKNAVNAKGVTKEFRIRVDNFRDAAAFPDVLDRYDLFVAGVPNAVTIAALTNGAVASVSGLPSGLKFDKKTAAISGTAAKPGKFLVTLRKTLKEPNGKGRQTSVTHVATTLFVVYQGNGLPDPASRDGEIRDGLVITPSLGSRPEWAGEKLDFYVGVPQKFTLSVEGLAGVDTTVTAKGLPSGLKFVKKKDKASGITSYTIEGVPKTASPVDGKTGAVKLSHVVLSGSNKYKWTGSAAFDIEVRALPAWAQGTYDGAVFAKGVETGTATLTVSAKGAVSGTIREIVAGKERKLTLKASSLASYDQARDVFTLLPTYKDGMETVTRAFELSASAADPRLGRVESDGILLLQNPWKNAGTKAEFADAFKPSETLSSDGLTLTVKANGAVTIAGRVIGADGVKTVSLSGSAQAIWNPEARSYEVVVYVAPKTNFGGLCRIVKLSVGPD